ncbi:hypothetical protein OPT61_g610 [Boeremia exigua]|uniref:Uncharacterized protein n=1 Tax=Boeremia exigua TaxID=749465 RepID=A0ACC2ITB1_9PLEO|nr:hypothetical protein OPT61_g610 [Boeremia exigua]
MKQPTLLLLSFAISRALADQIETGLACLSLFETLPGRVSFPQWKGYEESLSSYAYLSTRLHPDCIVSPQSREDVIAIIRTLGLFESVEFAVRGGGHNTNIGFANIEDGITVDLSAMKAITMDSASGILSVGPGSRWQSVYDLLDPYGIAVQGGRNGDVGIGGFLTGGGIGFFSPEKGWACDSVANFEVVLSDGSVVNANATSNTDLFTSLKGGSNNFGIITRFDLRAFKQGPVWGGVVIYTDAADQELIDTIISFKQPDKYDPHAMFTFGFVYNQVMGAFTSDIAMYHTRPENVTGSTLETFANVQPQIFSSLRNSTLGAFAGERLGPILRQYYMDWATTTCVSSTPMLTRLLASFRRVSLTLTAEYPSANLTIAVSIQSVPVAAPPNNPNSLGFDWDSHPEKDLLNLGIAFQWEDETVSAGIRRACKAFTKELDMIAKEEGVSDDHLYLGYAGSWQKVLAGYGQESLSKMRNASRKYDSKGMFQKQYLPVLGRTLIEENVDEDSSSWMAVFPGCLPAHPSDKVKADPTYESTKNNPKTLQLNVQSSPVHFDMFASRTNQVTAAQTMTSMQFNHTFNL